MYDCVVSYDAAAEVVSCNNLADAVEIAVYNLGAVRVGKASAMAGSASISLAGQPRGSYLLVIKGDGVRTHKFVKW